jgi:heme oxygenase
MALMLDDGVRKSHSAAESSQFVTGFLKGLGDRESFSQLVTSLYFVYKAMEEEFDATDDVNVKQLDFAELRRLPALEKDMAYFHGPQWRDSVRPSPATAQYCAQIRKVASTNPTLLVGHQYSRYVGDLFGGQMMGGMAVKSLGLRQGDGTSFYDFSDIRNTKEFIEQWYSTLNQLDLTEADQRAIVDEANVVFKLNIDLFEELEGSPISASWNMFVSSLKEAFGLT